MSSATYTLPFFTTATVAASSSIPPSSTTIASTSEPVETLISVLQRLEAKLDVFDPRPSASRPPPDLDPPHGLSWEWLSPSWTPASLATHSMEVSVPPWTSSTLPASSWPQAESFRQGFHEPISGMGLHTSGPPPHNSWDPPRSRIGLHTSSPPPHNSWEPPRSRAGDYVGHRSSWEQSASQGPSSSYEFDPILGRPRTSWDLPRPRIAPESCSNHADWDYWVPPTYSESYGGGGGYSKDSNNYNDYYNNEPQAWSYNNYESDRYNQVLQTVQYEPLPPTAYYAVAEPPQQHQHYYPQPPPDEVRPTIGFRQPSHAPQQLLPPQLAPWESPWSRTAPDSSHTRSAWDYPSTRAYSTSVAVEEEGVNRVVCVESEAGVVDGVATPDSDESVVNQEGDKLVTEEELDMKTEEEFVLDVDAMLEAGEVHACGSIKSSLPNIPLPTDGGIIEGTSAATRINSSISWLALRLQRYPVTTAFQKSSSQRRKMWYQDELWIDSSYQMCKLISGLFVPNVARGRIDLKFYALEEVYKDF